MPVVAEHPCTNHFRDLKKKKKKERKKTVNRSGFRGSRQERGDRKIGGGKKKRG
jgi:hypothetical protein